MASAGKRTRSAAEFSGPVFSTADEPSGFTPAERRLLRLMARTAGTTPPAEAIQTVNTLYVWLDVMDISVSDAELIKNAINGEVTRAGNHLERLASAEQIGESFTNLAQNMFKGFTA